MKGGACRPEEKADAEKMLKQARRAAASLIAVKVLWPAQHQGPLGCTTPPLPTHLLLVSAALALKQHSVVQAKLALRHAAEEGAHFEHARYLRVVERKMEFVVE